MDPKEIAYYYEAGTLGSFSTKLMDLICAADIPNKDRIAKAFPEYIEAYYLWFHKPAGWNVWEDNGC